MTRPLTCTLSGSMRRSLPELRAEAELLAELDVRLLSPRSFVQTGVEDGFVWLEGDDEQSAAAVQARHLSCQAEADFVRLVCPGGYVGVMAAQELGAALADGVPVLASEAPDEPVFACQVEIVPAAELTIRLELLRAGLGGTPPAAGLDRIQRFAADFERARGFASETFAELLVLFLEEVGELAAAAPAASTPGFAALRAQAAELGAQARRVRCGTGVKVADKPGRKGSLPDELADLALYLALLANRADVSLDQALQTKLAADASRRWRTI